MIRFFFIVFLARIIFATDMTQRFENELSRLANERDWQMNCWEIGKWTRLIYCWDWQMNCWDWQMRDWQMNCRDWHLFETPTHSHNPDKVLQETLLRTIRSVGKFNISGLPISRIIVLFYATRLILCVNSRDVRNIQTLRSFQLVYIFEYLGLTWKTKYFQSRSWSMRLRPDGTVSVLLLHLVMLLFCHHRHNPSSIF